MNEKEFRIWQKSLKKAAEETFFPLIGDKPEICDESDFFPGRRFFLECFSPLAGVLFLEMDFNLKRHLITSVFKRPWKEISDVIRDDCMLEVLNILNRKHIGNLIGTENIRFRCSSPRVIYDEYEDDLEVSTLDMFRFDFKMRAGFFAIIMGQAPGPFLEHPNL